MLQRLKSNPKTMSYHKQESIYLEYMLITHALLKYNKNYHFYIEHTDPL